MADKNISSHRLPQAFLDMINAEPAFAGLAEALTTEPSVAIRINHAKGNHDTAGEQVPWCRLGRYLDERPSFTFDPAMHQGLYYVQDASSMITHHAVALLASMIEHPITFLDACAAPGGKTTAAIDALPDGATVFANEYVGSRAVILRENLIKWGYGRCIVSRGDTARYADMGEIFDIIAADVPCSGEGMMRKDAEAVAQWSPRLVEECAERQREIVDNLWQALKPGGYLIYSTCTFNRTENEHLVDYLHREYGATSIDLNVPSEWNIAPGIDTPHHCYRFIPGRTRGEGLFMAVMQKPGELGSTSARTRRERPQKSKLNPTIEQARKWLENPQEWDITIDDDRIMAYPKEASSLLATAHRHLDLIHYGLRIATIKGRDLIPTQSLAMSTRLSPEAFPRHEVDYDTAIAYLRHEAIVVDDAPRGYLLLTYGGHPLGFVKNLGNRANNLYPAEWRILSQQPTTR